MAKDTAQEYAEIWGEAIHANRKLRLITVGLCLVLLVLSLVALRLAWQPTPKPIVVRVDEVGRAEALAYEAVEATADPLDPTTKYFLHRFIVDHYSRRAATVQDHWTRSLRFLATQLADATFQRDHRQIALVAAGGERQEAQVESVLLRIQANAQEPHGATADFDLVKTERDREVSRERWSLSLQFIFLTEIPPDLVVHNPMGIVVVYLQADRALGNASG